METKEEALKEMETWKGVNPTLYKNALYAYNKLPSAKVEEKKEKIVESLKIEIEETPEEVPKVEIKTKGKAKSR